MWWNEETDILDIIGGAKERLLDAAGFAAQVERQRLSGGPLPQQERKRSRRERRQQAA
jgi:hypothetical protein